MSSCRKDALTPIAANPLDIKANMGVALQTVFVTTDVKMNIKSDAAQTVTVKILDLLRNPLHPYTVALLTGTSEPDAKNATTYKEVPPGEPPSLVTPPPGCRFHPRCSKIIKGLCDVQEPPEFNTEADHTVLCWLYK
jgi:oligopeptide/dipeptide ABC transporter ATP-binding protein